MWLRFSNVYIFCSHKFLTLYSIEVRSLKKSKIYYLKKSIRIKDSVYSIRIKIGKTKPTPTEKKTLINTPNLLLEKKALEKRVELAPKLYDSRYIDKRQIQRLEKTKYWDYFFNLFLTKSEIEYMEETSRIEYIHGTTALEGNTFSTQQVDDLINKGITPSSKSLREINEVQNYLTVESYLRDYSDKVTLQLIRKLHELIMNNIEVESAGIFRRIDSIGIRGIDVSVAPSIMIKEMLQDNIDEYYTNIQNGRHPFEDAVLFHYKFEAIHPFVDGNGRVGRSILNYMLERTGFPRLVITEKMREQYLNALYYGNKYNYREMLTEFINLLEDKRANLFQEIMKVSK